MRPAHHRDDIADLGDNSRPDADFIKTARDDGLHFERHLVGLDLEEIVALLDLVADGLEPGEDLAFRDGLAELRHDDDLAHRLTVHHAADLLDDARGARQREVFEMVGCR